MTTHPATLGETPAPGESLVTTFDELVDLLARDGVAGQADPEGQRVVIPTELGPLTGEMVIVWDEQSPLVQFVHPLPFVLPEARLPALESAVARINHALLLPGFGLDHENRFAYFRLSVPRHPDGALTAEEIEGLFHTCVQTASDFFPALRAVALENKNAENILAEAEALTGKEEGSVS